jgi:hypothetical protein
MKRLGVTLLAAAALGAAAPSSPPTWEVSLGKPGEPGVPFVFEGRVLGAGNRPLRDVLVHVYHADDSGNYEWPRGGQPKLSGMARTNVLGAFRVRSVLPGKAEGTAHLHFEMAAPGADYRFATLSLCRATGAGSDKSFAHLDQMLKLPSGSGYWAYVTPDTGRGYRCSWDIPFAGLKPLETPPEIFAPRAH